MRFHLKRREPDRDLWPALSDHGDTGWIGTARQPFSGFSVGSLVPVGFERYARILHPAWAASGAPVRWDAVGRWSGRTVHALAQWELLARPPGEAPPACPFVEPPREGALPPHQLATLSNLLAAATSTPDRCRFATWEGYGWQAWADPPPTSRLRLDQRSFLVHEGPIEAAGQIGWRSSTGIFTAHPPTLIWPADRTWFAAGDVDLDSTYVGGSEDLIAALLAEPDLEAWPVDTADSVAVGRDTLNGS